jgi:Bacterial Ig-like domain (group 2)
MRYARFGTFGMLGAACAVVACRDVLLRPAAPQAASLSMVVTLDRALGGAPEAFDRADGAVIRFSVGGELREEETVPFAPSGTETVLRVDIPLRQLSENMTVDLELRSTGRPLFRGSTNAIFASGVTSTLRFTLVPVIASVSCAGPTLQFGTYGRSQLLGAAALFATGDTVPGAPISWSVSNAGVASITPAGLVSALADGDASVTCTSGDVSGNRPVKVFAVVNQVDVAPVTATLRLGDTLTLTPALRDSGKAVISTPRPINWSTSNAGAAIVSSTGVVTATGAGVASISATSGTAVGSATVNVVQAPDVTTEAANNVTASGATLNGTVNPHGSDTQAWFQYGTSATLATFTQTALQSMGSGTTATPMFAALTNLQPVTTYYFRALASSASGIAQGTILSFTTSGARPTLGTTGGTIQCSSPTAIALICWTAMSSSVNPGGLATQAWFEYSQDSTFATFSSTAKQSVGSGTTFVTFGGQAPTGMYFRAAAQNALGTVRSAVISPSSIG